MIKILKNEIITNIGPDQEWLQRHIELGTFGRAAYSYESELTPDVYEEQEILDEGDISFDPPQFETVLITAATYETINVPAEYEIVEEDTTAADAAEAFKQDKISKGKIARVACENVLDMIGGFNLDRELTIAQKNEMKATFADAKGALNDYQPGYAKYFINLITPDEVLVTTEMKDLCLEILSAW